MMRLVVMGVSGCGKSSVGAGLAAALGQRFVDGDSLHPAANIAKMAQGIALTDDDRAPWLAEVGAVLHDQGGVIACSALKRSYRDLIRATAGEVSFLYLRGRRETLLSRMSLRPGHFMPTALLDSQLATLEEPQPDEPHLVADIETPLAQIIAGFVAALR